MNPDTTLSLVSEACRRMDDAEGAPIDLADLARQLEMTPWQLTRSFRKILGITPSAYLQQRRAERFRQELKQGESVAGATYAAGYGSSSRVYEGANRRFGMTPASYAKGGAGLAIAYTIAASPLGLLLVAATPKGICRLTIGDREEQLAGLLKAEFPKAARLERDDLRMKPAIDEVIDYLAGRIPHPDLPLDIRATAFQRQVWERLQAIPPGETLSYGEVAAAIGSPRAARAVGQACKNNPVALLAPCHRVIRSDDSPGQWRWGEERKQYLLKLEREASAGEARTRLERKDRTG
ncbi:MAG: methylated-DNA--[protein]-cysteine S-methyltransferase [Rhodospirillales bacterium]|nr:methylated-DNA--[protein]-cysteine S-methyltransferase [Rhodospirillales bacterium]